MEFDEEPKSECTELPAEYKPSQFTNTALSQSKVNIILIITLWYRDKYKPVRYRDKYQRVRTNLNLREYTSFTIGLV